MVLTPTSFSYESLSSMKFKELQKLSVHFHVNKRWAKKQELIENLLALKNNEKVSTEGHQDEEKEWRDGSSIFSELHEKNDKVDKRLTFNVNTKSNIEHTESHLTFEVPQNGKKLLDETVNLRKTYDVPPNVTDFNSETLTESRATFDIPQKGKLLDEVDPRATFDIPQNGKDLLKENQQKPKKTKNGESKKQKNPETVLKKVDKTDLKTNMGKIKFDVSVKGGEKSKSRQEEMQVKTLTVPYARITKRARKDTETLKSDKSPIKLSKKSINIKKSTRLPVSKNDLIKSPAFSSVKKSVNKQTIIKSLREPLNGKLPQSKVPVRLQFTEKETSDKENLKNILRKRVSKTVDEEKKPNFAKVNFRTPPAPLTKTSKVSSLKKTPLTKLTDARINTSTTFTGNKSVIAKPITATKMPDFDKIHKRQFEQMDSLHDYLKKKEERIKKLFGTPQPGQQLQVLNKSAPVFRFQSTAGYKENKERNILNGLTTPLMRKEKDLKAVQKEAVRNKLPPSNLRTDIKDKNRSHIHGVRTNKRFELQMKFRKM